MRPANNVGNAGPHVRQTFLNDVLTFLTEVGSAGLGGFSFEKIILRITIYSNIYIFMTVTNNIYQKHKISRIQCGYEFRVDQTCSGIYNTTCASDFR
jgi:hypothetical protein